MEGIERSRYCMSGVSKRPYLLLLCVGREQMLKRYRFTFAQQFFFLFPILFWKPSLSKVQIRLNQLPSRDTLLLWSLDCYLSFSIVTELSSTQVSHLLPIYLPDRIFKRITKISFPLKSFQKRNTVNHYVYSFRL